MTFACPPLLRFALHAALALTVLLQASMAVAMHAPPQRAEAGESRPDDAPSTTTVAAMAPCHAMTAALIEAAQPVPDDGCGDSVLGESCRWACAQALGMTLPLVLPTLRPLAGGPEDAPIHPALRWIAQSPLRPPIG